MDYFREEEYYFLRENEVGCQTRLQISKTRYTENGTWLIEVDFAEKYKFDGYFCGGFYTNNTEDINIHNRREVIDYIIENTNKRNREYYFGGYDTLRSLYHRHYWIRDVVQKSKKRKER